MTTHTETQRVVERLIEVIYNGPLNQAGVDAIKAAAALITRQQEEIERLRHVDFLARALIADVRNRHPGEELQCPFMIALDAALEATK